MIDQTAPLTFAPFFACFTRALQSHIGRIDFVHKTGRRREAIRIVILIFVAHLTFLFYLLASGDHLRLA